MEQYQIPEFLLGMLKDQYGKELVEEIKIGYQVNRVASFRVNTLKRNKTYIIEQLVKNQIPFETTSWYEDAFIIPDKRDQEKIRTLEIYQNGEIYFQSLSSMLPPIVLNPQEKENILDMAAAPGGKTTQIAALTNNKAFITACEKSNPRAERLKYNLQKQGVTSAYVMVTDARALDENFAFDKILLDAPCSGSGTLHLQNAKAIKNLTQDLIQRSTSSQIKLLKKAVQCLKSQGKLIYSTCSILKQENENIIKQILLDKSVQLEQLTIPNMLEIPTLPTTLPGTMVIKPTNLYEGFFLAKLSKK